MPKACAGGCAYGQPTPMEPIINGMAASVFASSLHFRPQPEPLTVENVLLLQTLETAYLAEVSDLMVVNTSATCDLTKKKSKDALVMRLEQGDWFGLLSTNLSAAHLLVNIGEQPLNVSLKNPLPRVAQTDNSWLSVSATEDALQALPQQSAVLTASLFSVGVPVELNLRDPSSLRALQEFLVSPDSVQLLRGTIGPAAQAHGLSILELMPDDGGVLEVLVPPPSIPELPTDGLIMPLRVTGLTRRWSVGMLQLSGYCVGHYGECEMRYRSLGMDDANCSHVPVYPARVSKHTHAKIGHPVVAVDPRSAGQNAGAGASLLFIQVTAVGQTDTATDDGLVNVSTVSRSFQWHVSINNPTPAKVSARFVAGFGDGGPPQAWPADKVFEIPAGGHLVLL